MFSQFKTMVCSVVLVFVSASVSQAVVTWDYAYEGNLLPDAVGSVDKNDLTTTKFDVIETGTDNNSVSGGILSWSSADADRLSYGVGTVSSNTGDARWDASVATTLEIKIKVTSTESTLGNAQSIHFGNGSGLTWTLRIGAGGLQDAGSGATAAGDFASDFATIRIQIADPGDATKSKAFFIDANGDTGSLLLENAATTPRNMLLIPQPGIALGGAPTTADVDYVRWTHQGAFDFSTSIELVPEPATLGLLAMGVSMMIIRRKRA